MTDPPTPALDDLPSEQVLLLDQVCDRFEADWRAGRQRPLDAYLAEMPEPGRALLRRELLALEQAFRGRMEITLKVTAGPHKGRTFPFAGHDTFIVGRSRHAHFQLPRMDKYFSRLHFMVEVNPPHCRLLDLKSRNGTYVNGEKVTAAELHHGDQIRAGRTILRVAVRIGEPEPAAEPGPVGRPSRLATVSLVPTQPEAHPVALVPPTVRTPGAAPTAAACRVCAAALPSPASSGAVICPTCQEQIRRQPQSIPGHEIVRELGRGGMGIVYLALQTATRMPVALKTIKPAMTGTKTQVDRFLREASILRQLDHPHIVAFRDMGEANDQFYFAMDYVRGTDAARMLRNQGPLPIIRAVGLICQLLEALEYAHARGFVHRDIKPANLLVEEAGGREVLRLADFGLARVYHGSALSGLTMTGDVGGTTAFMPPEQIMNFREARPPADQYAAAATLYKLLTGEYVYDLPQEFEKQLLMIVQEPPVAIQKRLPDIPRDLAIVIHRSLAKNPEKRFADVKAMRLALAPFAGA
jgi:serine/threonine-protein kinase